ncbi:OLC1v1007071C1 [Oldenlandia corymbosa var. corymbosa]|uniref:OLC1v1007071C1 n=1 Tax=Oldenlandia corymbosa var. corymbosa TaxID=529605 RepID=A0AAV1DID1_OLDCO|nr:OLC1v1007071C1 [Oldenlandia corymbosa var. corymbosa]
MGEEEEQVLRWFNVESVPADYRFSMENRPGQLPIPICETIPVIDLQKAADSSSTSDKLSIIQQIIEASQEYGLFQVINHGVSGNAVKELLSLYRDFFKMPIEDKKCSTDNMNIDALFGGSQGWIYKNSTDFAKDGIHLWRDSIKHNCYPIQDSMQRWPTKPTRYREVLSRYLEEMEVLSGRILEMINQGLGLEEGYLREMSQVQHLVANYYPPCPDPTLTLGLLKHCDPSLITILVQDGNACGLQVVNHNNGQWMGVSPLPNALIVNIGNQLSVRIFN